MLLGGLGLSRSLPRLKGGDVDLQPARQILVFIGAFSHFMQLSAKLVQHMFDLYVMIHAGIPFLRRRAPYPHNLLT